MHNRGAWRLERRWVGAALLCALLAGYWLLPISGQVLVVPGRGTLAWPRMQLASPRPGEGATLQVTDTVPWAYVMVTVDGRAAYPERWWSNPGGTWTWQWVFEPGGGVVVEGSEVVFYHDCHSGCIERGRMTAGNSTQTSAEGGAPAGVPTKLGVVFANPERDWHGRLGWDVELTYACLPNDGYWGIDSLAARVCAASTQGLRVLVRVDYDRGQSLPPDGDYEALATYLEYLGRLARDARLRDVYGYIAGSGYNARDANSAAPDFPVTPAWYARLFNGYGEAAARTDNVLQTVRAENPQARVLVGPVRPWCADQGAGRAAYTDAPWLAYMDSLVAALDAGAEDKARAGIALTAPDGFAVQAPGRPAAPEMAGRDAADEPRTDLRRSEWGGAQAGFRVYRDWLAIANAYPSTRGLPFYITSANTFVPDEGVPPAQSYVGGWLRTALEVVNEEPQIQALCWFVDGPLGDRQWDAYSLSRREGQMAAAADEFDSLLLGE